MACNGLELQLIYEYCSLLDTVYCLGTTRRQLVLYYDCSYAPFFYERNNLLLVHLLCVALSLSVVFQKGVAARCRL